MKTSKRLLAFVLCAVLLVGMLPAQTWAAETDVVKVEHNGETTYYANLQKAFDGFAPNNNTYDGTYVVTLLGDTTGVNKTLKYPTNGVIHVTLDLNGYTVSAYDTTKSVINIIMKDGANASTHNTFTIKDSSGNNSGKITGGKGGVIFSGKNCTLNFEGGTITGNHGASKGGGILVGATAFLNMTGGVITGNSVTGTSSANSGYGGGVLVNYGSITGGVITGNTAYKGSHAQTGRGGGVCTEITRTKGYSTLTIANGTVYGNTAENAGDDVMAQSNGMSTTKWSLSIGTENWYIDGWNGKKATAGNGEAARYSAESPVAYTDGGFTDTYNKSLGLKYVAPSVPEYTVTYTDGVEGEEIFADQSYTVDEGTTTPAFVGTPTREGYAFIGWTPEVAETVTADATYTAIWEEVVVLPEAPDAPDKYGSNVTTSLVRVICDTDPDHAPMTLKWQHQSTKVRDWESGVVWSDEYNTWIVPIRIDSVKTYYVWAHFEEEYNEINHPLVDEEKQSCIDTYLKWDAEQELWVTLDGEPIDVHVTCKTAPTAPSAFQIKNYQVKVTGVVDGEEKVYFVYIDAAKAEIGEVKGSREEGFTADVTVKITENDALQAGWIAQRDPDATVADYQYDWSKTPEEITITLNYTGDLVSDLYGDRVGDWALANGMTYGTIGEAYVVPAAPAAPEQGNVVLDLVTVICDSDPNRHAPVTGKWYPQHCKTTSDIVWNEAMGAYTVDVRIGGLYIMYVDQLEDANGGTIHELVEDITTVYTTLKWDTAQNLWVPVEPIELHTTCQTAPTAPTYNQLNSYQVKVWGDVNGEQKSWTTSIPEDGYTISEVYGSREEGFFVDVTITLTEGDIYQSTWIAKKNPGYFYNYDWDQTAKTVTFTLKYNGSLTGTLHGDRHASNTNYDWVLADTGIHYGVVSEAYLKQITCTVNLVIYRNGNTTTPYKTVSLGQIAKGETLDLSELDINEYYTSAYGFEMVAGYFNDGRWNQYKAGQNVAGLDEIYINGWTNIICMVTDYQPVKLVIYRNGNTTTPYKTVTLDPMLKGDILDLTAINVADYYTSTYGFEVVAGLYNDGRWNQYKAGQNVAGLDEIKINGWTNVICMVYDYQKVVVKGVVNGDKNTAETIFNGKALYGENLIAWLDANVTVPEKPGYTADKWYNWDWYGHKYNDSKTVSGWTNAYVDYQANQYTLTLDPNGGKVDPSTITVTFDEAIGTLPDATRTGYIFDGWVDADGNEVTAETIYTVAGDSTITAKWIRHPGSSSQNVTNELFTIQCTEVHDHSWLCNWFGSHVKLVTGSVKWNEELGRWEAQAKIGSGMMSMINSTQPRKNYFGGITHHYDETNYVFDLYYDPNFTGLNSQKKEVTGMWLPVEKYVVDVYCYTEPSMPNISKISTTALWMRDAGNKLTTHSIKYTVKNLIEGTYTLGEMYTENGKFYVDLTITDLAPYIQALGEKTGKTYVIGDWQYHNTLEDCKFTLVYTGSTTDYKQDGTGWSVDASSWANNSEKLNGKSLWLTEQFTVTYTDGADGKVFADQIFTVNAYTENGATKNAVTDFAATATPTVADPSRKGYTFLGWTPEVAATVTGDVTYTAQWEIIPLKVYYYIDGELVNSFVLETEAEVTAFNVYGYRPEKTGYTLDCWYEKSADIGKANKAEPNAEQNFLNKKVLRLYGSFVPNDIKLTLMNGDDVLMTIIDKAGEELTINTALTKKGYTFVGWYTAEGEKYNGIVPTEDTTYYAKWEANDITLTLINGDKVLLTIIDKADEELVLNTVLSKEGYTFVGWYTADGEAFSGIVPTEDTTYYAKWEANDITLTLMNGEKVLLTIVDKAGEELTINTTLTKKGYTFIGWYTAEGEAFNGVVPTKDTTYYAKWEANDITLTLMNGDKVLLTIIDKADEELTINTTLSKEGYTFVGWYTAEGEAFSGIVPTEDTTYYAKWEANDITLTLMDGEKVLLTIVDKADEELTINTILSKEGYTFAGWYTAEGEAFNGVVPTKDTVYYASWTANEYKVTLEESTGGEVAVDKQNPTYGDTVTVTVNPNAGMAVDGVTVTVDGVAVTVTENSDGTYSFTQPAGDVTVVVTFKTVESGEKPADPTDPSVPSDSNEEPGDADNKPATPPTGDNAYVEMLLVTMFASLAVLVLLIGKRRQGMNEA